jgi:hypothetical protein
LAVKILMSWDVAPGREQEEYFEFVVRELLPGMQRLGLELSDAWVTIYGEHPQILMSVMLPSAAKAEQVMLSTEWQSLFNKLQDFVTNYSYKIVPASGGFQF